MAAAAAAPADPPRNGLSTALESDLRMLSTETRRSESFTSWLTGPDYPQLKEAAERGVLKLRSTTGRPALAATTHSSKVGAAWPQHTPKLPLAAGAHHAQRRAGPSHSVGPAETRHV